MESNRDEAFRCVELSKLYIKKKDLDKAWKFSVKAHKLFPSSKTKCELIIFFMILLFMILLFNPLGQ